MSHGGSSPGSAPASSAPRWISAQRYLMGSVLALLALRILTEKKPA